MAAGGPDSGFAAAGVVIVVAHPPVHDRVAQLHDARGDGVLLDLVALAVDASELPGLAAAVVLADMDLDLLGELPEAAVEVAGDPVLARLGDARGGLGGVVAFVLAEQHDLGSMSFAAQQPRLVVLLQLPPEIVVSVG